jgi:putative redox protein
MSDRTFSRNSLVATPAGGAAHAVAVRGHRLLTDQPERSGGKDAAPTPLELMGAALSGCVSLYVQRFLASRGLPADGVAVEVRPVWRDEPGRVGRYDVILHLPAEIPAELHAEISRAATACPVHNTLTHPPELTLELRV